jgi:hypothetical protein
VRQNGVSSPQKLLKYTARNLGVLVAAVPEEALCDFAKMVFTDPS